LTGFRAVAAWLIFAHHYNPFSKERFGSFLPGLLQESYIGVSLFFVLSGFLITMRYDNPQFPRPSFARYMQNRFARIYPLYFLLTTLTFFVAGQWGWIYVANITFIKGFIDELKFTGISQGWSLTVEETFYVVAPLIFLFTEKFKRWWLLPILFVATGLIIGWISGRMNFVLVYTFLGRSSDFFAGILLAKFHQRNQPSTRAGQVYTWSGVSGILGCLVLLNLTRGDELYGVFTIPGLLIHHLLVPASTAMLLFGLLTETSLVKHFLTTGSMQLLGRSSYAFYLVHLGVVASWLSVVVSANAIVLFVLLNALAVALYYAVERPLQRLFRASSFS
jgi:peptidoglycan/LPS O-acetylase OafA/YrhL